MIQSKHMHSQFHFHFHFHANMYDFLNLDLSTNWKHFLNFTILEMVNESYLNPVIGFAVQLSKIGCSQSVDCDMIASIWSSS